MPESLSKVAGQILSHLPPDGKPIGNIVLRRELELNEEKFFGARSELIRAGLATSGKGKGGSLRRVAQNRSQIANNLPIEFLVEPFSREGKSALKSRMLEESDEAKALENKFWQLVYQFQPVLIASERDPVIQLKGQKFQPDVFAIFDRFLLVADCKNTYHGTYVSDWMDKVEFFKDDLYSLARKVEREFVVYLCVVKDTSSIDEKVQSRARKISVRLLDARKVSYFAELHQEVGIGVRHLFWSDIAPRVVQLEEEGVPALAVRLGRKRECFVFSMNAHKILPRALISHREIHDPEAGVIGYQRMLNKARLKSIATYINSYKTFPTPIVLILDKNVRFDQGKSEFATSKSRLGRLWLPGKPRSMQVVDGQHRLFGYSLLPSDEDHILQVIAYRSNEDLDPASMFVDINSKQKPVPSGLMWELYPDIYDPDHDDYYKAMISVAVEKSLGDLKDRVHHITSGTTGLISFSALCSEIPKTTLLSRNAGFVRSVVEDHTGQVRRLEKWLSVFFAVLLKLENQYPKVVKTLLLRNVGIIPALRLFGRILKYEYGCGNTEITTNASKLEQVTTSYLRAICQTYEQKDQGELEKLRSQRSSQGGYKRLYEEFVDSIDKQFRPGFAGPRASDELQRQTESLISTIEEINRKGVALGATQSHTFKEFDQSELRRIARKKLDSDSFEKFVKLLHQEIVEGSGENSPNNRLAKILGMQEILSLAPLKALNSLRVYFSHKSALIDASKRRAAVEALQGLLGSSSPPDPSDLDTEQFEIAACNLIRTLIAEVLDPTLQKLKTP